MANYFGNEGKIVNTKNWDPRVPSTKNDKYLDGISHSKASQEARGTKSEIRLQIHVLRTKKPLYTTFH